MNATPVTSADEAARTAAHQALSSYDAAHAWAFSWITVTERLADLAVRATQTLITEQRAIALAMLEERSPLGAWRLQTGYALAGTAKSVAYARHASEIVLGTIADAVTDAESRANRQYLGASEAFEHVAHDATASLFGASSAIARAATEGTARIVDETGKAISDDHD